MSLKDKVANAYIDNNYKNSKVVDYKDLEGTKIVLYKDLPNTAVEGYPISSDRDENGNLRYYFLPSSHELAIGTTGSGKTTGCVEPRIRALASKKNKPNFVITDPKGELFGRNAMYFKRMGYRVSVMNFKNPIYSNTFNPIAELYDVYMKLLDVGEVKFCTGSKSEYILTAPEDCFDSSGEFFAVKNLAFATEKEAKLHANTKISEILGTTSDGVRQLCYSIIPKEAEGSHDPSWIRGGRDILYSLIFALLEDAIDSRSELTPDAVNMMNVEKYGNAIKKDVLGDSLAGIEKCSKVAHKDEKSESIKHIRPYSNNALQTRRSYFGCYDGSMQDVYNFKTYSMTCETTVDISEADSPFVVFIITREYEKSDYKIAGIFIDWVYRTLVNRADENNGKLDREMYFILDEFANLPPIANFDGKITTARSRNIWFHLFIQSYSQLQSVYDNGDSKVSNTIKDNCNSQVFLGSQNYETKCTFSRECGTRCIPNLASQINQGQNQETFVNLVPMSVLETLPAGTMVMRRLGMPVIMAQNIRSYLCPEFHEEKFVTPADLGIKSNSFLDDKYQYEYLDFNGGLTAYAKSKEPIIEIITDYVEEQASTL